MKKAKIPKKIVKSLNHFKEMEGVSFYGVFDIINSERSTNPKTIKHTTRILKYFNDFDEHTDSDKFLKCWLGHYKVKK